MTLALSEVVPRRLIDVIAKRMLDEPVLVLQGPRSVGKSTLLQALGASVGRPILDLDRLHVVPLDRLWRNAGFH